MHVESYPVCIHVDSAVTCIQHGKFMSHSIPIASPHPPKTSSNVDEIGAPKGNLGTVCCCFGSENSNLAVETVFTSLARLLRDAVILL